MTETAVETAVTDATATADPSVAEVATTEAEPAPLPPIKPLHRMFLDEISGIIANVNQAASTIAAAKGNDDALAEAVLNEADPNSDLGKSVAKANKIKDALSDLEATIKSLVETAVKERKAGEGEVDLDAAQKIYDEGKKEATANKKMLQSLLSKEFDASVTERILSTLPEIAGARKSGGTSAGAGKPRVRGFLFYVDGSDTPLMMDVISSKDGVKTTVQKSNIAAVANHLSTEENDVEQETVKAAFYEAAGTTVLADMKDEINFTVLDGENVSRNVKAVKEKAAVKDNGAAVTVETAS